jgi:hypothetical protein
MFEMTPCDDTRNRCKEKGTITGKVIAPPLADGAIIAQEFSGFT